MVRWFDRMSKHSLVRMRLEILIKKIRWIIFLYNLKLLRTLTFSFTAAMFQEIKRSNC